MPFRFWGCGGIRAMDVGGRRRGRRKAARGGGMRPASGKEDGGAWWRQPASGSVPRDGSAASGVQLAGAVEDQWFGQCIQSLGEERN